MTNNFISRTYQKIAEKIFDGNICSRLTAGYVPPLALASAGIGLMIFSEGRTERMVGAALTILVPLPIFGLMALEENYYSRIKKQEQGRLEKKL